MDNIRAFKKENMKYQSGIGNEADVVNAAISAMKDIKNSDFYKRGEKELESIYNEVKRLLAEKMQNMPDMPMGKLLFLAPIIKETADVYSKQFSEIDRSFEAETAIDYWILTYLLDMFFENVSQENISVEDVSIIEGVACQETLKQLSETMSKIVADYPPENQVIYNGYLTKVFSLTLQLAF